MWVPTHSDCRLFVCPEEGVGVPRKTLLKRKCDMCGSRFDTKHMHQETCSRRCGTSLLRKRQLEESERDGVAQVWACGGGVQSTAIAALIYTERLPPPALAWIVDVGYECSGTFDYVASVITPKMREAGVTLHTIRTCDYKDNSLFDNSGHLKIPAFEKVGNTVRMYKTRCNGGWKVQVAKRWLREQGVKRCDTWLGISVDEARRARPGRAKWNQLRYPLIELGLRREDCIDLVARLGWQKPEHTSCFICPMQSDFQWRRIRDEFPENWRDAVNIDRMIRTVNPNIYLHPSCVPLEEAIKRGAGLISTGPMLGNRMSKSQFSVGKFEDRGQK